VHAHGVDVGAVEQAFVGGRIVGADLLDQLELAEEFRTRLGRLPVLGGLLQGVLEWGGGLERRLLGQRVCAFRAQYRSS
jgi:hypothetical protein